MHCDRSPRFFFFFGFCFTVFIFQIWRHHFIYLFFVVLEDDAYLLWSRCNLRFFWLFFFEKNFIIISYPICVCVSPGFLHFFLSLCSKNLYVWGMGKKRFKNKPFPSKKKEKRTEFRPMAELDGWSVGSPVDSIFYSLPVLWKRRRTCFVRFIYIFFLSGLKGAEGVVGGGPSWSFPSSTRSTRINQPTDPIKNCRCLRGQSTASNGGPSKRTSTDEKRNRMMRAGKKERKKERKKNNLRRGKAERVFPLSISVRLTATQTHTYKKKANK